MGLIDFVAGRIADRIVAQRQTTPERHDRSQFIALGIQSEAAIPIVEQTALGQDVAFACGSLISKTIASLPVDVLAPRGPESADGNEHLPDHPVAALLQ